MEKAHQPSEQDLKEALSSKYELWSTLKDHLNSMLDQPGEEWNYPGKKYGWSFRMKSKKRNIIYFLPREGYFKTAFVFGNKATEAVMQSSVKQSIKSELQSAKVYAEGRGIRIDVNGADDLEDIKKLIQIKLAN